MRTHSLISASIDMMSMGYAHARIFQVIAVTDDGRDATAHQQWQPLSAAG